FAVVPGLSELEKSRMQLRLIRRELIEQHARLGDEHAGVPEIAAVGDVRLRRLEVGLLHEPLDQRRFPRAVDDELFTLSDVSEADGWFGRSDADRADVPLAGNLDRVSHGELEHSCAPDDVV